MSVHVAAFLLMLVGVLLRKRLRYEMQSFIIVLLLFLIGCGNLLAWGLISTFDLFSIASAVFVTVFVGFRSGIFVLVSALVFMAFTGIVHGVGWLSFPMLSEHIQMVPVYWYSYIASLAFLAGGCIVIVGSMFQTMRLYLMALGDRAREADDGGSGSKLFS